MKFNLWHMSVDMLRRPSTRFLVGSILFSFTSFFVQYSFSQSLSIAEFGAFSIFYSVVLVLVPIVVFGQPTAVTYIFFRKERSGNEVFSNAVSRSFAINLILFFTVCLAGLFYIRFSLGMNLDFLITFPLLLWSLSAYQIFSNLQVILERSWFYLSYSFAHMSILVATLVFFRDIISFSIAFTGLSLFSIWAYFSLHNPARGLNEPTSNQRVSFCELMYLGAPAIPAVTIGVLNSYLDRFIIDAYLSKSDVGLYAMAATIGIGVGTTFINALSKAWSVVLMKFLQDERYGKFDCMLMRLQRILIYYSALISIIYFVVGDYLVSVFLGVQFFDSGRYIVTLFNSVLILGLSRNIGTVLVQSGRLYVLLFISIGGITVNLAVSILLVQFFGLRGVIIGVVAANFFVYLCTFFFSKVKYPGLKFPTVASAFFLGSSLAWLY